MKVTFDFDLLPGTGSMTVLGSGGPVKLAMPGDRAAILAMLDICKSMLSEGSPQREKGSTR